MLIRKDRLVDRIEVLQRFRYEFNWLHGDARSHRLVRPRLLTAHLVVSRGTMRSGDPISCLHIPYSYVHALEHMTDLFRFLCDRVQWPLSWCLLHLFLRETGYNTHWHIGGVLERFRHSLYLLLNSSFAVLVRLNSLGRLWVLSWQGLQAWSWSIGSMAGG